MPIYGTAGNDTLLGTTAGDFIYGYPEGTAFPETETGNDSLRGGSGNDRLYGGGGNDTLRGDEGYDRLYGQDGDDVLQDGGTGLDEFDGGNGNDLFLISGSGNDTFLGGAGSDTLRLEGDVSWSRLVLDAAASVEVLDLGAGVLRGTTGNDLVDLSAVQVVNYGGRSIEMLAGNNTFLGHAGADHVTTAGGYAKFTGAGGNDTLRAIGSLVEFDGGDGDDLLLLSGYGWNDTIMGGAGMDTVRLDAAADRHNLILDTASGIEVLDRAGFALTGTGYSDRFDFSGLSQFIDTGPRIDMGNGQDVYIGWSGNDAVSGGAGYDTLIGGAGNDTLDGGTSVDSLAGGAGNDLYVVDRTTDVVDESGGTGRDRVLSSVSFSLAVSPTVLGALEDLTLTGRDAIDGRGNALDNRIQGNAAANLLAGRAGDDTLLGGAGNDRLDGGTGFDLMIGGTGNDTYVIDGETLGIEGSADRVVERAGEGRDRVIAYTNVTLAANVEDLTLKGEAVQGKGNGLGNAITGNAEDNLLSGLAGNDRISGGAGDDRIAGDDGKDRLSGGSGDDRLTGGSGADRLDGGAGRDRLAGDAGADSFVFSQSLRSSNADHVTDFRAASGDRLLLDGDIFRGLGSGQLDRADFRLGTAAIGGDAQIIYDRASGRLWYDADGAGGAAKQLIATLDNHAGLGEDDIFVF